MDILKRALEKVSRFKEISSLEQIFSLIQLIPGGNKILKKIASSSDLNQIEDYLNEVRFALFFADLGFQIEVDPFGDEGPDLKILKDNQDVIVEITRFRKINPGPPELYPSNFNHILPEYGNPDRDVKKTIAKIINKYRQIKESTAIICIWNDDGDIEECDVRCAVNSIKDDSIKSITSVPNNLLFILYGSYWVQIENGKQFYCFPLIESLPPHVHNWIQEFEKSRIIRL